MARCAVSPLMVGYRHHGQRWRQYQWRRQQCGQEKCQKNAASVVDSLLREAGQLVALSRASSFIWLVFILAFPFFVSVNVFVFGEASTSNVFL